MKPLVALLVLFAALAGAGPAFGRASCAGKRPTHLTFTRAPGQPSGKLSWRRPSGIRSARLRYRVYRNRSVVGQTGRRSMAIGIVPGRTYYLAVRAVGRGGRASRCAGSLRARVRYYPPGAPGSVSASQVSDTAATLRWSASRRGDGRVTGYRIYRDGRVVRQVEALSARVTLVSGATQSFAVRAADGRGHLSPPSRTVRITAPHHPPPRTTGLTATSNGDSEIELRWSRSDPTSGRIVGYRVYRDGNLVRQVDGLGAVVDNLAPATRYRFTVAAVDSLGYVGAQSEPAFATTAPPPPTLGRIHTFLLATTDRSFADLQAHYRQIGTLYPTYYACRADASISGQDDPLVTRWAQLRRIAVLARFDCQRSATLHLILTDPQKRAETLAGLLGLVDQHGYEGLNLDFESGAATDRDALTAFVADLAEGLHARGKTLTVDVSPKYRETTTGRSAFYDYAALARLADRVFVMNWGLHWSTSPPGSIDDLSWAVKVADYVATMPEKEKFVLGAALYGMDWAADSGPAKPAVPLEYEDVRELAARVGARPVLDPTSYSWHFSYVDEAGLAHEVWYSDALTLAARVRLASDRGLGIGFWRLGREDQGMWSDELLGAGSPWP